jgi:Flp pilus assembly protein TadD
MNVQEAISLATRSFGAGDLGRTQTLCRQVLASFPNQPDVLHLLGLVHYQSGDAAGAADLIRRAVELVPARIDFQYNLGKALMALGRQGQAIDAYRRAAALPVREAGALTQLALEFSLAGAFSDALACSGRALAVSPNDAAALAVHGQSLFDLGRFPEAMDALSRAIALRPDDAVSHYNRAMIRLSEGDYANGWPEFEWRFKLTTIKLGRDFPRPQWTGEEAADKTLLVHAEGGFGDTIQYIRYAPMLHGRVGRVILECQPALIPLLASMPGIDQIIAGGQALPEFDLHIPLPSLPGAFKTELTNIPNTVPYLTVPADRLAKWSQRVPRDGRLNVGLVWAGNTAEQDTRSVGLARLGPLAAVGEARFFSLQVGKGAGQVCPAGLELIDHTAELGDFADTGALLSHLDLLISADTSVPHLAGALGRPVWLLTPFVAPYQWLRDRIDSPWYPTMRLFRQKAPGDWSEPVAAVVGMLKEAKRASDLPPPG